ncbi:MAG: sigma-70 family RNA polymerase sigma factor [Planctomycetes bacterium]|nr:sigma-70 family RNA polymerase sigma factor [Planctomycetota bacterium]
MATERVRNGLSEEVRARIDAAIGRGSFPQTELDITLASFTPELFEPLATRLIEALGVLPIEASPLPDHLPHPHDLPGGSRVSRRYLHDLEQLPMMSREDESIAAKRLEFALERLAAADFREPSVRAARRSEYQRFFNEFVERNLHTVVSEVYGYRTYDVPLDDLIQEGNAALMHAVEKFDWRKGVRFRTYVAWWIRQAVERYMAAVKGAVRVPHHLQQKLRRLKRQGRLPDGFGQSTSVADVALAFEVDRELAGHLVESSRASLSLEQEIDEGGERFRDLLATRWEPVDSDRAGTIRNRVAHLLNDLDERERTVLRLRFGLDGGQAQTLEEIGTHLHLSRERSRQIQQQALIKLRTLARRTGLEQEV